MDASVRDFLVGAQAKVIVAAQGGRLRAMTRKELMEAEGLDGKSLDDVCCVSGLAGLRQTFYGIVTCMRVVACDFVQSNCHEHAHEARNCRA